MSADEKELGVPSGRDARSDERHTSLPWRIDPSFPADIIGGDGRDVAETTLSPGRHRRSNAEQRANAAFIVLSANAHHGLVEALSALGFGGDLADEKIGWCGSHSTNPDHFQCEFCFAIHEDCTLIAHLGNCPIPLIRQSLKLTEI